MRERAVRGRVDIPPGSINLVQQTLFDVAHAFINTAPPLTHRNGELSLDSFRPDGFVGIGVPIGTDNFVRQFVAEKYRDIIEDVEKLDPIEDSFIHFQILRFARTLGCNILIHT